MCTAPGSVAPIASISPACASEITNATPDKPRATNERKNASQPAPSSDDDVDTKDFSLPVGIDRSRDQGVHVHRPPALTDLLGQRVDPHEGVRAGVKRPVAKRGGLGVEALAISDTWLFDSRLTPSCSTSFSTRRVLTPSKYDVATTLINASSARRRRSNNQSGKYEPDRSFGIANSIVPARVSHSRAR